MDELNCAYRNENGFCMKYSNFAMDWPCKGDADCEGYAELDVPDTNVGECEYCNGMEADLFFQEGACRQMNDNVYITGNSIVCDFGCKAYASFEIKFCPVCGRKLEEV